jgi:hypothetical protein
MGRPKKQTGIKGAQERLSKSLEEFETIYNSSTHLGEKAAAKEVSLALKQLTARLKLRLRLLPDAKKE